MKIKRQDAIGIKQVIRLEWMEKAAALLLAGLDNKSIRQELQEFLMDRKGSGKTGERSAGTRTFAVNNLMRIWVNPDKELIEFRDSALQCLSAKPAMNLAVHWAMVSAAYPFWFNVARQTGRLLNLQNSVTQQQVTDRLKEQYGDRTTISRYVRYVLRSFVAWGVLKDIETKGSYQKCSPEPLADKMFLVLLECALHTTKSGKIAWDVLLHDPALFPFEVMPNIRVAQNIVSSRFIIEAYGPGEQYLSLRGVKPG